MGSPQPNTGYPYILYDRDYVKPEEKSNRIERQSFDSAFKGFTDTDERNNEAQLERVWGITDALVSEILGTPKYSHAFTSPSDKFNLNRDIFAYVSRYLYEGERQGINLGLIRDKLQGVEDYIKDPEFIRAIYNQTPEQYFTDKLRREVIDDLVTNGNFNSVLLETTDRTGQDAFALIQSRPDVISTFTEQYAGKYGNKYGNDYATMAASAPYQTALANYMIGSVLIEFGIDPEISPAMKSYVQDTQSKFFTSLKENPDVGIFSAGWDLIGDRSQLPLGVSTTEATEIEALITGELGGVDRMGNPMSEEYFTFSNDQFEEFQAEYLASGETSAVTFYEQHWKNNLPEHLFASNSINPNYYDAILTPRIKAYLGSTVNEDWQGVLVDDMISRLMTFQQSNGIKDRRVLWDTFIGKGAVDTTDGSSYTTFDYTRIDKTIENSVKGIIQNPLMNAFLERTGVSAFDIISGSIPPPVGMLEGDKTPEFTTLTDSLDYLYQWANFLSDEPIVNPGNSIDVLSTRVIMKNTMSGTTWDGIGGFFQTLSAAKMAEALDAQGITDADEMRSWIQNNSKRISETTVRTQLATAEGGDNLLLKFGDWGVTAIDGMTRLGREGDYNIDTFDSVAVADSIKTAGIKYDFTVQYAGAMTKSGKGLIPTDLLPTFMTNALSQQSTLYNDPTFHRAIQDPAERERLIKDSPELLLALTNQVDLALDAMVALDPFAAATIDLYGGVRGWLAVNPTDTGAMSSTDVIEIITSYGKALTDEQLTGEIIDSAAVARFKRSKDALLAIEAGISEGELLRLDKVNVQIGDGSFSERSQLAAASSLLLNEFRTTFGSNKSDVELLSMPEFDTQLAERHKKIVLDEFRTTFGEAKGASIGTFLQEGNVNPRLVSKLSKEANALLNDLSGTDQFKDATPDEILASMEFTSAFDVTRSALEEDLKATDFSQSPEALAIQDQSRRNEQYRLLDPTLKSHISKLAGTGANDVMSALGPEEYNRLLAQFESSDAGKLQGGFVGYNRRAEVDGATGETTYVRSDEETRGELDQRSRDLQASERDQRFKDFLNTELGGKRILGLQRQGRVSRIRTATPTGGKQIRNLSVGVGL